jgi:hypothetical protein
MVIKKKVTKKTIKKVKPSEKRPLGIKIISTYYIIVAILIIITGLIASLFYKTFPTATLDFGPNIPKEVIAEPSFILLIGIILLVIGTVMLILGINLWKLKTWARIVIVIIAVIGFVSAFLGLLQGQLSSLAGLFIEGIIASYLIFSKKADAAFK